MLLLQLMHWDEVGVSFCLARFNHHHRQPQTAAAPSELFTARPHAPYCLPVDRMAASDGDHPSTLGWPSGLCEKACMHTPDFLTLLLHVTGRPWPRFGEIVSGCQTKAEKILTTTPEGSVHTVSRQHWLFEGFFVTLPQLQFVRT